MEKGLSKNSPYVLKEVENTNSSGYSTKTVSNSMIVHVTAVPVYFLTLRTVLLCCLTACAIPFSRIDLILRFAEQPV